jgi:FMN phosphatase YigB (HAD superfamily)
MRYLCDNMRHLVCVPYSIDGLHEMARDLGIKRCWFHRDHYDIPKRRVQEIQARCEVVSPRKILRVIKSAGGRS